MCKHNIITFHEEIRTPEKQVEFLTKYGVLNTFNTCNTCKTMTKTIKRRVGTKYYYFECDNCHKQTSIRKGTILYSKGISFRSFLMLAYFFIALNMTHAQLIHNTNLSGAEDEEEDMATGGPLLSCKTIVHYTNIFRDMIAEDLLNSNRDIMIGGLGTTVEIDESMFGKRKYRRGRITGRRQMWVLGGVCR